MYLASVVDSTTNNKEQYTISICFVVTLSETIFLVEYSQCFVFPFSVLFTLSLPLFSLPANSNSNLTSAHFVKKKLLPLLLLPKNKARFQMRYGQCILFLFKFILVTYALRVSCVFQVMIGSCDVWDLVCCAWIAMTFFFLWCEWLFVERQCHRCFSPFRLR